ncbi:hypothetical protein IMSHALPRED_010916 [Imshaugia aleurites]|uniref:Methyltransferase domain-containing protein n=1 Tax=Imshaugia aleurites TaxID=172621 RepID=A0A8H3G5A7_9LECA|nr:hypothetical protein IMSHALPRED_010916 [Imshaugia aleurites]
MASNSSNQDEYILSRGLQDNMRLNLQHYLWNDKGYLLHPSIPIKEGLRIAEIGVGTGIWSLETARIVPKSAQIDGFDIDISQCPPRDLLPKNVTFSVHNCLTPFPHELTGTYDVVHIRLFILFVQENDPGPLLRNFLRLLKPGGYISWSEYEYKSLEVISTSIPEVEDSITPLLHFIGSIGETKPSWTATHWPSDLPQTYKEIGLTNIEVDRRPFSRELLPFYLDACLAACEEISYKALDPLGGGKGERARSLVKKCLENRQKSHLQLNRLTVLGRKPEK